MKLILLSLSLLMTSNVFAISEQDYATVYQQRIVPMINTWPSGFFTGAKDVKIKYATFTTNPSSKKCVVVLPGRSESLVKYAEVVDSLETLNPGKFAYFLMDHRGQGSSGRMIKGQENSEKGHVDEFENYVADLRTFMDTIVVKQSCKQNFLLAHSLGAGIGIAFMQEYPEVFDRAALTSPMLKIQTKPYKYALARTIVLAQMALFKGKDFSIGQKGYNPDSKFEDNSFTTSQARFNMTKLTFNNFPETKLGGVTNGWLNEIMKATKHIRKHYDEITIPVHMFHAGIETYSEPSEMVRFCDKAPHCTRTFFPESKHEVMMDRDVHRDVVMAEVSELFK
jgi:lysophospholipase